MSPICLNFGQSSAELQVSPNNTKMVAKYHVATAQPTSISQGKYNFMVNLFGQKSQMQCDFRFDLFFSFSFPVIFSLV